VKFKLLVLSFVGVLTHSSMVAAQNVDIQTFQQVTAMAEAFTLRAPARAVNPEPPARVNAASLWDDFANLTSPQQFNSSSDATLPRKSAQAPRWMTPNTKLKARGGLQTSLAMPNYDTHASCAPLAYTTNPRLPAQAERRRAIWYTSMIDAACEAGVPVQLFDALIVQESGYNPTAVSPKGAAGLAQLMPSSARFLGVHNVWDPHENMRGGARFLRSLLDEFGRYDLALAAYNAGAGRVRAMRRVPRISETIHYVSGILLTMQRQLAQNMASRE
jgi:soluble lytic murein transglycosylase-like protein